MIFPAPTSKTAPKTALITGITGQDPHIDNAPNGQRFKLHYGDLSDSSNLTRIIQETQPDEIYNLRAQIHVADRCNGDPVNVSVE